MILKFFIIALEIATDIFCEKYKLMFINPSWGFKKIYLTLGNTNKFLILNQKNISGHSKKDSLSIHHC